MRKKEDESERLQELLGSGGEVHLVPLFIPVETYNVLIELGRTRGISPGDVLSNAVIQYAQPKPEPMPAHVQQPPAREPDVVIRRRDRR